MPWPEDPFSAPPANEQAPEITEAQEQSARELSGARESGEEEAQPDAIASAGESALTEEQAEALRLRESGATFREIAEEQGVAQSTAKRRVDAALESTDGEEGDDAVSD